MADFEKDELTEEDEVQTGAEDAVEEESGVRTDLDDSLEAIEEEEQFEDTQYDDENNYIGDDPDVTDPEDWATPEFTPEGSDIPVEVDLESLGESWIAQGEAMEAEGQAILDVLGPSGNEEFDALVMSKDKSTVSYPDPQDPSRIVQEDSDKGDWDGLGFDSDYTEERVHEGGDGSPAGLGNEARGDTDGDSSQFPAGDLGDVEEPDENGEFEDDEPVEFSEEDYED